MLVIGVILLIQLWIFASLAWWRAKSITTWTPILVLVGHSNKLLGKLECCLTWTVSS
jgi:hypothetical protein